MYLSRSSSLPQIHTQLLTSKWHELLVLTTCSYQAIRGLRPALTITPDGTQTEFQQEVSESEFRVQRRSAESPGCPVHEISLNSALVGAGLSCIAHVS